MKVALNTEWHPSVAGSCKWCGRKGRYYPAQPGGYAEWFEWAEKKGRTHEQEPCPGCGRLSIWRRKPDQRSRREA